MRKSLILVLTAVGGGASYAAGITEVGGDSAIADPSTWRWHVSSILADQQGPSDQPLAGVSANSVNFIQRHQRYSPLGLPEHPSSP